VLIELRASSVKGFWKKFESEESADSGYSQCPPEKRLNQNVFLVPGGEVIYCAKQNGCEKSAAGRELRFPF